MRTREIKKGASAIIKNKKSLGETYKYLIGKSGTIVDFVCHKGKVENVYVHVTFLGAVLSFKQSELQLVKKQKHCKDMQNLLESEKNAKLHLECPYCKNKKDSQNGYKLPLEAKKQMENWENRWENIIKPILLSMLESKKTNARPSQSIIVDFPLIQPTSPNYIIVKSNNKKTNWSFWFIVLEVLVLLGLIIYFW